MCGGGVPAACFNGMSDGIGAVRRAERQTEHMVDWLDDDRVGVTVRHSYEFHLAVKTYELHRAVSR